MRCTTSSPSRAVVITLSLILLFTSPTSGGLLEDNLLAIEATVTDLAELAERDHEKWICGHNPGDVTELKCFHHSCKSKLQNPQCSSEVKSAFGGCTTEVDHIVVGFDETTILFGEENLLNTKEVSGELFWTSGVT
jgi:hypothetical protein